MTLNAREEADLRAKCEAVPNLKPGVAEDIVERARAGKFNHLDFEGAIKDGPDHWFFDQGEEGVARRAFGPNPSLTAQGEYLKRYGLQQTQATAAKWGAKLGSTKPGIVPESERKRIGSPDHKDNPFSAHPQWVDPRTGRYNAKAMSAQSELTKRLGAAAAAKIANSVGVKLGATRPAAA